MGRAFLFVSGTILGTAEANCYEEAVFESPLLSSLPPSPTLDLVAL